MPTLPYETDPDVPSSRNNILIFGGADRTLDLLRLATIRSDNIVLVGQSLTEPVRRYAAHFAVEIQPSLQADAIAKASAVLVAIGDAEAENSIVRTARRHAIPIYVADRTLVSDFTLIEFLEQRPHTSMAA